MKRNVQKLGSFFILSIAIGLIGCSGSGRHGTRLQNSLGINGLNSVAPGGRMAAVLSIGAPNRQVGTSAQYAGQQSGNGIYPGQSDAPGQQNPSSSTGSSQLRGGQGAVQVLALFENESQFVRDDRQLGFQYRSSVFGSGVTGRATGPGVVIDGVSDAPGMRSQAEYIPDGSVLAVTATNRNEILAFPMYDGGGMGAAVRVGVGSRPTEIAMGFTRYGEMGAFITQEGLSIVEFNRIDALNGTAMPTGARLLANLDRMGGHPIAAAFGPPDPDSGRSEYLYVTVSSLLPGVQMTGGAVNSVFVCDIGKMLYETRSPAEVVYGSGRYRGCGPYNGGARVAGVPIKMAVTNALAAFLNPVAGPAILPAEAIPNGVSVISGMLPDYLDRSGYQGHFQDMIIQPYSGNIIAADGPHVRFYTADEPFAGGETEERLQGGDIVSLAGDPGPDPEFMLAADQKPGTNGLYPVWIGRYSGRDVYFNNVSDFIQITRKPVDVAIRTRSQLRQPFAPVPVADNAGNSGQPAQ